MKYFDSHSHYYDERFRDEYPGGAESLLEKLFGEEKLSGVVNVGTSPETSRLAIAQAKKYEKMYTAIGVHPSDATYLTAPIADVMTDIRELILDKSNKCVAIGECGFDYHYPDTNKPLQYEYFDIQMQLARELSMPVCIHDRDSHGDVMDMIRKYPDVRGVLHSYSGSAEMAKELVSRGYLISFSGVLTFTNAKKSREVAKMLPRESVLIETDCPYLAPHPHRGELNHSGNLEYTNKTLSEIFGVTEEECSLITEENARRFFGI